MSDLDDLLAPPPGPAQHEHAGRRHDHGPTIDRDPMTGDLLVSGLVSATLPESVDEWTAQVKALGLGIPDGYVVEMVSAKHDPAAWSRGGQGEDAVTVAVWRCSYRIMRDPRAERDSIMATVGAAPAVAYDWTDQDPDGWCFGSSDAQTGRCDDGGTPLLLNRWNEMIARKVWHYERVAPSLPVHRFAGGDIIEGTVSQGGGVVGRSDLPLTDQVEVAVKMSIAEVNAMLSNGAPSVTNYIVPSNHGQISRVGTMVNTRQDASWDVHIGKMVDLYFDADERVRSIFPSADELTVTADIGSAVVGLAHGHRCGKDTESWLNKQSGGRTKVGDSDIFVRGHDHTGRIYTASGDRLVIHLPAICGKSMHHVEGAGQTSRPRMLSWVLSGRRVLDADGLN